MDPQTMAQLQMYQQLFGNRGQQQHPALTPAYQPTGQAPNGAAAGIGQGLVGAGGMPGLATALMMRMKRKPPNGTPIDPNGVNGAQGPVPLPSSNVDGGGDSGPGPG